MYKYIIITICFFILFSCEDKKGYVPYDDVEVTIERFSAHAIGQTGNQTGQVYYTVENTGNTTLEYWKIVFNLHFTDNPSVTLTQRVRNVIPPGDITDQLLAKGDIPGGKHLSGATLQLFEIME